MYIDVTRQHFSTRTHAPPSLDRWDYSQHLLCYTCHSLLPLLVSGCWGRKGKPSGSSAAQAKHVCNHSSCCVDWCPGAELCCRWLISRSGGYTSPPMINCPINPAAELLMHSSQGCTLQQSDADACAHLADLCQTTPQVVEEKCSYRKDSLSFVFKFPLKPSVPLQPKVILPHGSAYN